MATAKNTHKYTYTVVQKSKLDPEKSIIEKHGFVGAFRLCDIPGKLIEADKQIKEVEAMFGQYKAIMGNIEQNNPWLKEYIKRLSDEKVHALKMWAGAAQDAWEVEQDLKTVRRMKINLVESEKEIRKQTGIILKK